MVSELLQVKGSPASTRQHWMPLFLHFPHDSSSQILCILLIPRKRGKNRLSKSPTAVWNSKMYHGLWSILNNLVRNLWLAAVLHSIVLNWRIQLTLVMASVTLPNEKIKPVWLFTLLSPSITMTGTEVGGQRCLAGRGLSQFHKTITWKRRHQLRTLIILNATHSPTSA